MTRTRLVAAAERVSAAVDEAISDLLRRTGPCASVRHLDWAYLRLGTVISTVRFGSAGASTAMVARSLIEDAVMWDWAIAKGVADEFVARSAAAEWHRLRDLSPHLPWLLPPGTAITTTSFEWLAHPADHLRRLGSGAEEAAVAPLRIAGLSAVNDVLETFAHCNVVSLFACPDAGHLPAPLTAAAIHLAGAATAAIASAVAGPSERLIAELDASARALATEASIVHRLPAAASLKQRPNPARARRLDAVNITAQATRFPQNNRALDDALTNLLQAIGELVADAVPLMMDSRFSAVAGRLSVQTLSATAMLFRQALAGESAGWNTPFAGRLLVELGGFWGWAQQAVGDGGHPGQAMRAFARSAVTNIDRSFRNAGLGATAVDRFLGPAAAFREISDAEDESIPIPATTDEMLRTGYGDFGGAASRTYRLLSQFAHGTGLGVAHLVEDGNFGSVSEPMRAVAAAGLALGADQLAGFPLILACGLDATTRPRLEPLRHRVTDATALVLREVDNTTGIIV